MCCGCKIHANDICPKSAGFAGTTRPHPDHPKDPTKDIFYPDEVACQIYIACKGRYASGGGASRSYESEITDSKKGRTPYPNNQIPPCDEDRLTITRTVTEGIGPRPASLRDVCRMLGGELWASGENGGPLEKLEFAYRRGYRTNAWKNHGEVWCYIRCKDSNDENEKAKVTKSCRAVISEARKPELQALPPGFFRYPPGHPRHPLGKYTPGSTSKYESKCADPLQDKKTQDQKEGKDGKGSMMLTPDVEAKRLETLLSAEGDMKAYFDCKMTSAELNKRLNDLLEKQNPKNDPKKEHDPELERVLRIALMQQMAARFQDRAKQMALECAAKKREAEKAGKKLEKCEMSQCERAMLEKALKADNPCPNCPIAPPSPDDYLGQLSELVGRFHGTMERHGATYVPGKPGHWEMSKSNIAQTLSKKTDELAALEDPNNTYVVEIRQMQEQCDAARRRCRGMSGKAFDDCHTYAKIICDRADKLVEDHKKRTDPLKREIAELRTAIAFFFGPTAANALADSKRTAAIHIGGHVFLPSNNSRRVITEETYKSEVTALFNRFRDILNEMHQSGVFQRSALGAVLRAMAEMWVESQTCGCIDITDYTSTGAASPYYRRLFDIVSQLRNLGIDPQDLFELVNAIYQAGKLERAELERHMAQIDQLEKKALSAALAFGAFTILTGGLATPLWIVGGALAMDCAKSLAVAGIQSSLTNKNFFDAFSDSFSQPGMLEFTPYLALISGGQALFACMALRWGIATYDGAMAFAQAMTTFAFINQMGICASRSGIEGMGLLGEAMHASRDNPELAKRLLAQAFEKFLDAGVDLAFIAHMTHTPQRPAQRRAPCHRDLPDPVPGARMERPGLQGRSASTQTCDPCCPSRGALRQERPYRENPEVADRMWETMREAEALMIEARQAAAEGRYAEAQQKHAEAVQKMVEATQLLDPEFTGEQGGVRCEQRRVDIQWDELGSPGATQRLIDRLFSIYKAPNERVSPDAPPEGTCRVADVVVRITPRGGHPIELRLSNPAQVARLRELIKEKLGDGTQAEQEANANLNRVLRQMSEATFEEFFHNWDLQRDPNLTRLFPMTAQFLDSKPEAFCNIPPATLRTYIREITFMEFVLFRRNPCEFKSMAEVRSFLERWGPARNPAFEAFESMLGCKYEAMCFGGQAQTAGGQAPPRPQGQAPAQVPPETSLRNQLNRTLGDMRIDLPPETVDRIVRDIMEHPNADAELLIRDHLSRVPPDQLNSLISRVLAGRLGQVAREWSVTQQACQCPSPGAVMTNGAVIDCPPVRTHGRDRVGRYARDSSSRIENNYLENQMQAEQGFNRDFWNRDVPLDQLLRDMHRTSSTGNSGRTFSNQTGQGGYNSGQIRPGQMRTEGDIRMDWNCQGVPSEVQRAEATRALNPKNPDRAQTSVHQRVDEQGRPYQVIEWRTPLEGIPPEAQPRHEYDPRTNSLVHTYPDAKYLDLYIKRMEEVRAKLQAERNKPPDQRDPAEITRLIAEYYQLGINTHMFTRVNQSLMMNQVNAMLEEFGMPPVMHGGLDFQALNRGTRDFARTFADHLNNPQNRAGNWNGQVYQDCPPAPKPPEPNCETTSTLRDRFRINPEAESPQVRAEREFRCREGSRRVTPEELARRTPELLEKYNVTDNRDFYNGDPSNIRFGQASVTDSFGDGGGPATTKIDPATGRRVGKSIDEVVADLRAGRITPDQLPIEVIQVNGQTVAVNNRSLTALRMAGMQPTVVIPRSRADLMGRSGADSLPSVLHRLEAFPSGVGSTRSYIRVAGPNELGVPRQSWDWDCPFGMVVE